MNDWEQIIRRDGPAVWRAISRLVSNRADAEECFQEACLDAVEISIREEVLHPRALLLRLATLRAMDRLRVRYRRAKHEDPDADWSQTVSDHVSPQDSAEASELSERLRVALAALPESQSAAFCLCCLEGWSYQEAAGELSVTAQNVGVLVHRARQKLKELFRASVPGIDGVHHV